MKVIILFIILTIVNVIIQTIKSICTIKCGKGIAAIVNAVAYGLYPFVIFYTSADGLSIWWKAIITALANLVGIYLVKLFEEKARKDKLWRIECTLPTKEAETIHWAMKNVPHNYIKITDKHTLFNFYCATQTESAEVKKVIDAFCAKYFVSESKTL